MFTIAGLFSPVFLSRHSSYFSLFLCLCSDCYLSSVHSIPSESWKTTLANNPLCAGAPAPLFWVHHTHGYSCCAATACITLLTQKPGEWWLDAITVFCTHIVISLLEWLLFKIFKVLLSFGVWANKEVSRRTSSANLLKNASRKCPKYYRPCWGGLLVMFKWKILNTKQEST